MDRTRTFSWQDPRLTVAGLEGRTGLEFLRAMIMGALPPPPITHTLGFALTAAEDGLARFEGLPAEDLYNPIGVVHGGWAFTLLDSAMGCAVMTTCDADTAYTTAQVNVHFTRAITLRTGRVTASARIVHRGARVATAEGRLTDPAGALLAHATTTCLLFPRAP